MTDSIFFDDLYKQFGWYDSLFTPVIEECSKQFFFNGFNYRLVSISTNMNVLAQNDTFFVTKVKINSKNDVYIRISQDAINVILDKVLGKNNRKFELTEVLTNNGVMKDGFNTAWGCLGDKSKIITFAENSPMKKLGIDQALVEYNKRSGCNTLSFWQEGSIVKSEVMKGKEEVNSIRTYLKVIRDLIDSHYKLPS